MFDHVTIRVSDRELSERFYELVLATLAIPKLHSDEHYAEWHDFSLARAGAGRPRTTGLHVGFVAPSRQHVDDFWSAGTAAGYRDDGPPGPRPQYAHDYYGSFLLDPDGNSAEAVYHGDLRRGGVIDHLWIRVADVAAATRFYAIVAPHGGFRLSRQAPERAQFTGTSGSFSLVRGEATENVHLAFPGLPEAVDAFHRAVVTAGYRDNGPPGERPVYHKGYYSAFVLDPDGNNVEIVSHDR